MTGKNVHKFSISPWHFVYTRALHHHLSHFFLVHEYIWYFEYKWAEHLQLEVTGWIYDVDVVDGLQSFFSPLERRLLFIPRHFNRDNNQRSIQTLTEAAEAFRKWRGIGQKGHFCIWSKSNDFMSFTSRTKIFENMESLWRRKWLL
jgi:hypothetical protein